MIVLYPDFKEKSDIRCSTGIRKQVKDLWDELPIFRDNMDKVATVLVPYKKELITSALSDPKFEVQSLKCSTNQGNKKGHDKKDRRETAKKMYRGATKRSKEHHP